MSAPKRERLYAEHYGPGDRIHWPAPPLVRQGSTYVPAPSAVATVSWSSCSTACVRFSVNGELSEPTEVVGQQPCEERSP